MTTWGDLHSKLYEADRTIINKLESLLINQECNEGYLEHGSPCLLDDPLTFIKTEDYDFTAMPVGALLDIINILKQERNDLASMFVRINNERKILRQQNMKLMERLFAFENFQIENFDRDFNQFLNRSFFVNYELLKKFLHRERTKVEDLQRVILQKNSEITGHKREIQALEKKVLEARERWKMSILDTPVTKNPMSSVLSTKESTADSKNKSGASHARGKPDLKLDGIESELDPELEASINDKVKEKIRTMQSESAIFDDDFDLNTSRNRGSQNKDLSLRIVQNWEDIIAADISPLSKNNRITFGVGDAPKIHHQHTNTPIFPPNMNFCKPTESALQKAKEKTVPATTTNKPNGRTMSKAQIKVPEIKTKPPEKPEKMPSVMPKTTVAKSSTQIKIPKEAERKNSVCSSFLDETDKNECNTSAFSVSSMVKGMGETAKDNPKETPRSSFNRTPLDIRRPSAIDPGSKMEHSKSSASIMKKVSVPSLQNGLVTPLRNRPAQTPKVQAATKK